MTILVTGGTGTLGQLVVVELARRGVAVRSFSRGLRGTNRFGVNVTGDLVAGEGLAEALEGVTTVIHCAHDSSAPDNAIKGLGNLLEASKTAGVAHFVYIGIAGIEPAADFPYYAVKLEEERMVMDSGLGWSILRSAQFCTLVHAILTRLNKGNFIMSVPRDITFRPIAVETVAHRLVDIAMGPPQQRCRDIAGPETRKLEDMAREWLFFRGRKKMVLLFPSSSPGFKAFRKLDHGDADQAGPDWTQWLLESMPRT
ncbi:NAD(P)H-binding protein [Roseiarcaceae bacterium H3SJ34-1]|uniref:SDR family oxidoreductase n=1 Tax=Terripilifer ovatus TaxID=3032367 RepID=UPI003AB93009|nr:NAD(P)H-binding protein [Roseiarcaceae bacterium H3SJ34-1]